ncbi:Palmdelphin [Oryzias melastigma]|uniref:Palmdelphin n=1 Tax=Oryzias melastigma TaxID=30732 RepID=A0A834C8Y2_ORYME|nr:Palmdelphin [Oryzias melastigma]
MQLVLMCDPLQWSKQGRAIMEEAELLKERLQAITDKRRIQEDIAKKRRRIEEEKLKLQYIKVLQVGKC